MIRFTKTGRIFTWPHVADGKNQKDLYRREETQQRWKMESPHNLFLRRIVAGVGYAVHSLVFEAVNGTRSGYNLHNHGHRLGFTDEELQSRGAYEWIYVAEGDEEGDNEQEHEHEQQLTAPQRQRRPNIPTDYIVEVTGYDTTNGLFLCSGITLVFASGRSFTFNSFDDGWRGRPFAYRVEQPGLLTSIDFNGDGRCSGITSVRTTIHLPLADGSMGSREAILMALPTNIKVRILLIHLLARRIDQSRHGSGLSEMGTDMWWNILSFLRGIDFLPLPD